MGLETIEQFRNRIAARFPKDYWTYWQSEYGHDFFDFHFYRTYEYDRLIGPSIQGKKILEIGGFPGLLVATYLERGCRISTIDSKLWTRPYYIEWAKGKIELHYHEILDGAPSVEDRWDTAIMSDVLIHIDGFPREFLRWVVQHCDEFILCTNAGRGKDPMKEAKNGSMTRVFDLQEDSLLRQAMAELGAFVDRKISISCREVYFFRPK